MAEPGSPWSRRLRAADPRRQGRLVLGAALVLLVAPPLVDLLAAGPRRLFALVAPDTFYYLVVGRNAGLHGSVSYDGQHWSNGFHPLWQALVSALYALGLPGVGTHLDLAYLIGIGFALLALAVWLCGRLFQRADGSLNPLFALLPVGGYALLVCGIWLGVPVADRAAENPWEGAEPLYGTLWSAGNGMETAATVAAFAGLAYASLRWRWQAQISRAALLGGLLALLGLARLDHLIFSLALWALLGWRAARSQEPRAGRRWAISGAVFFGILAVYLLTNKRLFGTALPISGQMKSSWPIPTTANADLYVGFYSWIIGRARPPFFLIWRVLQSAVPCVVALGSPLVLLDFRVVDGRLTIAWAGPNPALSQFLGATALGVVGLAGYDFLFVPPVGQGHWYYPVSMLFVSLVALVAAERLHARMNWSRLLPWMQRRLPGAPRVPVLLAEVACCAAVLATGVVFYVQFQRPSPGYHARYADFYFDEAPLVKRRFGAERPRLLCLDDGIVAYATDFPAMSATGLGLDAAAAGELKQGRLVDVALRRGFTHVTSLVYIDFSPLAPDATAAQLRTFMGGLGAGLARAADFPLSVAYRSQRTGFGIVKIGP